MNSSVMLAWFAVVVASLARPCGSGGDATRPRGSSVSRSAAADRAPIDRVCELTAITPFSEAVDAAYDPAKERIRVASYVTDKTLARVK